MIEILDNDKEDVMNEYKQEEVLPKIEPDQRDGEHHTVASKQGETRRSGRVRVANRQLEDYELCYHGRRRGDAGNGERRSSGRRRG